MGNRYDPINLFLQAYNHVNWFENEELNDTTSSTSDKGESADLSDMPPLEGNEKEGKGLKILTPNQLLTRLQTLLAQIKSWK